MMMTPLRAILPLAIALAACPAAPDAAAENAASSAPMSAPISMMVPTPDGPAQATPPRPAPPKAEPHHRDPAKPRLARTTAPAKRASQANLPKPAKAAGVAGRIERVSDGDTFKILNLATGRVERVRLLGVDCPESHANNKCKRDGQDGRLDCAAQVPLGKTATKRGRQLLEGQTITMEPRRPGESLERDHYERILAYIRLADGRDYGEIIVREGVCQDFGWKWPHPRSTAYLKVQPEPGPKPRSRRRHWK